MIFLCSLHGRRQIILIVAQIETHIFRWDASCSTSWRISGSFHFAKRCHPDHHPRHRAGRRLTPLGANSAREELPWAARPKRRVQLSVRLKSFFSTKIVLLGGFPDALLTRSVSGLALPRDGFGFDSGGAAAAKQHGSCQCGVVMGA